jgi:hypothetical protein
MSYYSGMGSKKMAWAGLDKKGPKEACTEATGHHYQTGSEILMQDPGDRSGLGLQGGWALWETVMAQCCIILLSTLFTLQGPRPLVHAEFST